MSFDNIYSLEDFVQTPRIDFNDITMTVYIFRSEREPVSFGMKYKIKKDFSEKFKFWKSKFENIPSVRIKMYESAKKFRIRTFNDTKEEDRNKIDHLLSGVKSFFPSFLKRLLLKK